jgi:hypothetical protein
MGKGCPAAAISFRGEKGATVKEISNYWRFRESMTFPFNPISTSFIAFMDKAKGILSFPGSYPRGPTWPSREMSLPSTRAEKRK